MPELPEVETVRRTLEQLIKGKQIRDVTVRLPRIVRTPDVHHFVEHFQGLSIHRIERRGKFLLFDCSPWVMVSHLRMEGKYQWVKKEEPMDKHVHVIFHFTDDTELRYQDVRQFGTMDLIPSEEIEQFKPLKQLGVEPLSDQFTLEWFQNKVCSRTTKLKPLLLNQTYVVGLGNIYVDEALHHAGLHPERSAASLTPAEVENLHSSVVQTLQKAVEAGGSSVRSYLNGQGEMGRFQLQIQVYGQKGKPCTTCGTLIERMVMGGRGTHYCPQCQK